MNRPVGADLANANREETIEERVLRRGGLESRERAEIVILIVAHAGKRHVNQSAVFGLERDPEIEREGSIRSSRHPVAAASEHTAAKPFAVERAASDREYGERAVRRRADVLRGRRREAQDHQRTGID